MKKLVAIAQVRHLQLLKKCLALWTCSLQTSSVDGDSNRPRYVLTETVGYFLAAGIVRGALAAGGKRI